MTRDNTAPIGVFDSGFGGLTAVRELRHILPGEDIVYFGDTGRVPYGTKGRDVIINYAKQDIALLLDKGVKYIVAACGTVSSTLPRAVASSLPVGYSGVVQPTVAAAVKATRNKRIGVIGTGATMRTNSYQTAIAALDASIEVFPAACPLFVPLVENGHFMPEDPLVQLTCAEYLTPVKQAGVDTLILGCTHYPLLQKAIGQAMGPDVMLVDAGRETAIALKQHLTASGLLNPHTEGGKAAYYVTDEPEHFESLASIFLGGETGGPVQRVNIDEYNL